MSDFGEGGGGGIVCRLGLGWGHLRDEDHGETGLGESWEMGRGGEMSVQDGKTVRHRVSRKWHEKNMAAETAEMQFVLFGVLFPQVFLSSSVISSAGSATAV